MKRKINSLPLILLFFFAGLLDYYVFSGLRIATANLPESREIIHAGYWAISAAILFFFMYMLSRIFSTRKFNFIFNISFNSFITVFVSKLVFAFLLLSQDVFRLFLGAINTISTENGGIPNRSALFIQIALVASAVPFLSFLFGVTLGRYHYKVRKTTLFFEDLPDAFDGFKIVQISDIHAGSFNDIKSVQKGINLINAQNPDMLAFTGDLVNNNASEILPFIDLFKQIEAPHGKFSVLGNHDYGDYINWDNAEDKRINLIKLKGYHADIGFRLLLDEHQKVEIGNSELSILGVENWGKGFGERGDLKKAMKEVDISGFKILLSHDPSHWDAQVKNNEIKIHLTLSGHTHGMQFGIEIGRFKWSPAKYRYPNWAGLAEENGRYLYVNRGFGFLGFAGRVGIWPEITLIELKKG